MALRVAADVGSMEADVSAADLVSPDTPAGWAGIWALVALVLLIFTVGRGERGLGRVLKVAEFVFVIALAMIVANYLVRAWSLASDSDMADGLAIDM